MRVTVAANKLENVDVDFISLVARGANRVPFRIIKAQENGMINLSNLGSFLKQKNEAAKKAELYGIVLPKAVAENVEVMKAVAAAGAKVDKREEKDGIVLLKQQDGEPGDDAVMLKLSDHVGIVMKGFHGMSGVGATDFNEILKTQGFFPGFSMATEALFMTVRNILMDEEVRTTNDAVTKVDGALDSFHQYVNGILSDVPATAFKVEKAVADTLELLAKAAAEKAEHEPGKNQNPDGSCKPGFVKLGDSCVPEQKAEESVSTNADGTCKAGYEMVEGVCTLASDAEKAEKLKAAKMVEAITNSLKPVLAETLKGVNTSIEGITQTVSALSLRLDAITKTQDELKGQVTQATETAKKVEDTLKGITIGGLPLGDPDTKLRVKSETGALGLIDTAFNTNVRKKTSAYTALIEKSTRRS